MRPEAAKNLQDVQQACQLLTDFTRGKTFADYSTDALLRSAVERQFITIGEALSLATKLEPALGQSVSSLRQIIGFRNILVHGYAVVQHATVWGIIENDLPALRQEVDALLGAAGTPGEETLS
jgi:uncharacterized protein with HEPN domain